MANKLKIIPLGGVGEIGKNMTLLEYNNDIIVVDCGLIFPDEDMPGIDIVIPDMTYLRENADRFRGFLITHGHEDHIGALPYALREFNVPVYGTAFTIALIEHKLEEMRVRGRTLRTVKPGDKVEFIYHTPGLFSGVCISVISFAIFMYISKPDKLKIFLNFLKNKNNKKVVSRCKR